MLQVVGAIRLNDTLRLDTQTNAKRPKQDLSVTRGLCTAIVILLVLATGDIKRGVGGRVLRTCCEYVAASRARMKYVNTLPA